MTMVVLAMPSCFTSRNARRRLVARPTQPCETAAAPNGVSVKPWMAYPLAKKIRSPASGRRRITWSDAGRSSKGGGSGRPACRNRADRWTRPHVPHDAVDGKTSSFESFVDPNVYVGKARRGKGKSETGGREAKHRQVVAGAWLNTRGTGRRDRPRPCLDDYRTPSADK